MGLSGRRKIRIGDILINEGIISPEQLDEALAKQRENKKRLGEILVNDGYVTDETMANALCHQLGYERADLQKMCIRDSTGTVQSTNTAAFQNACSGAFKDTFAGTG